MSGDYSRDRFDPHQNYSSVRQQQGRVSLDADWNEAWDIQDRRWRAETMDILGRCAVSPETPLAFKIQPSTDGKTFTIGTGRLYVDGLLAENFGVGSRIFDEALAESRPSDPVSYADQPFLPDDPSLDHGRYLIYLDVWEREVTHVEDPSLLEPALGGVDTTVRLQTVWQVRASLLDNPHSTDCNIPLDTTAASPTGRLSVSFDEALSLHDPCELPPTGGYRGAENHLYRIQIHDAGALAPDGEETQQPVATFKWSRDNALLCIPVTSVTGTKLTLASLGRDSTNGITKGDWVEILDNNREFRQQSGDLARVVDINQGTLEITLDRQIPLPGKSSFAQTQDDHRLRRTRLYKWDKTEELPDGTSAVSPGPFHLENGIQLAFSIQDETQANGFRVGDYWQFAARPGSSSFELLQDAPPKGIHHHYCRLAIVDIDEANTIHIIRDCRPTPSSKKGFCCSVTVGDGVVSHGDFTNDIQAAIDAVKPGGRVCILAGSYTLSKSLILNSSLTLVGCGKTTRILAAPSPARGRRGPITPLLQIKRATGIVISDILFDARASRRVSSIRDSLTPNCAVSAEDVDDLRITNCDLVGYPAISLRSCQNVQIRNNRISGGGIWACRPSYQIEITENTITGGAGPGILLGDAEIAPGHLQEAIVRLRRNQRSENAFGDGDTGWRNYLTMDQVRENPSFNLDEVAEVHPPSIESVQIRHNTIEGMGASGITTLYQANLRTLQDIANLGIVQDVLISENSIRHCVQSRPTNRFPDNSRFAGGILLAGVTGVSIRYNNITDNGCEEISKAERFPACGILLGDCGGVDISNNYCADNGVLQAAENDAESYLQAELALLYVRSSTASGEAAQIKDNVVRCKAGQSLVAITTGSLSVVGNTLESQSYRKQPYIVNQHTLLANNSGFISLLDQIQRSSGVLILQVGVEEIETSLLLNGNRVLSSISPATTVTIPTYLGASYLYCSVGIFTNGAATIGSNHFNVIAAPKSHKNEFWNVAIAGHAVQAFSNSFGGRNSDCTYVTLSTKFNLAIGNVDLTIPPRNPWIKVVSPPGQSLQSDNLPY